MRRTGFSVSTLLCLLLAGPGVAQEQGADSDGPEIVVTARPADIVVNGRLLHWARRPGDPVDRIDVSAHGFGEQMMIARDPASGRFVLAHDTDPIGGSDWQRAGTEIGGYVYRVPVDGLPLCICNRRSSAKGFGQLRQIVDATSYRRKAVRFTGYIASRAGGGVRLWLAAAGGGSILAGNSTQTQNVKHRSGWLPFVLEIKRVPDTSQSISYGFLLDGPGDVWVDKPTLVSAPAQGKSTDLYATPIG